MSGDSNAAHILLLISNGVNDGFILMIAGLSIMIFSHPKISRPIISRLFNEGAVTPKIINPKEAELISGAGPSTSIFAIGFVFFFIGLIFILIS